MNASKSLHVGEGADTREIFGWDRGGGHVRVSDPDGHKAYWFVSCLQENGHPEQSASQWGTVFDGKLRPDSYIRMRAF